MDGLYILIIYVRINYKKNICSIPSSLSPFSSQQDTARNERQARRNLRIRGLLKTWRDTAETAPKPFKMDELAKVAQNKVPFQTKRERDSYSIF